MEYQIIEDDEEKFVEIQVKIKVYLEEDSEKTGTLTKREVKRLLFEKERVDLGEEVLNSFSEQE